MMEDFKEWLSDYLRYILLILAVLLVFALAMIGVRVYQHYQQPAGDDVIEILPETGAVTEHMPETETESETTKETETASGSEVQTEKDGKTVSESETRTESGQNASSGSQAKPNAQPETHGEPETDTEPETEAYVPVYKTLKGSCYIRSGPSMEADIIGEYMYGTTVEFLEDVGGWYKVQIDGMVGYMGARFF